MANNSLLSASRFAVPPSGASGAMRRDVSAAYVAALSRIGAWAAVSAIVYRLAGPAQFGTLALIRGTIGLLNYTAAGLTPALIRLLAEAAHTRRPRSNTPADIRKQSDDTSSLAPDIALPKTVEYASLADPPSEQILYSNGIAVARASVAVGLVLAVLYAVLFNHLHAVPSAIRWQAPWAVLLIGLGTLLRLYSDAPGAVLQTRGRIALDSYLLAGTDAFWAVATIALFRWPGVLTASLTYACAAALLVMMRSLAVARLDDSPWPPRLALAQRAIVRRLLSFGFLVLLSQLAEYFYSPTDYILINHFFGPAAVAGYAPAMQIDSGLLMLVTGLSAVLLPRAALAHTRGARELLGQYYLRGTAACTALLLLAAIAVWALSPWLFRLWFGPRPPDTRPILLLVLASTVIGGSSAVGRSVLLGMGKFKPYAIAAIVAGVVNVIASYCFVKYAGLGLRGIIYGTLLVVVGRCGVWMPWYVMYALRREESALGFPNRSSSGL
ncbi:MAG TPA: lipopolysaccharide biosynthesis protein [Tepidisphaeraceae bacterium]|nr:lipopolysaccharide biosynthesis protein [Tepidisphaeraceae bacterium]